MKRNTIPLFAILMLATFMIVGCGDTTPQPSADDVAWVKQKRLQEMYGVSSNGTTTTNTQVQYVTITNTATVSK